MITRSLYIRNAVHKDDFGWSLQMKKIKDGKASELKNKESKTEKSRIPQPISK